MAHRVPAGHPGHRDTAAAILPLAEGELARGPVWVGIETGPSGGEGEDITFEDDGAAAVDTAIGEMSAAIAGDPNLRGFMVDSFETWSTLE